jgi:hypothetical protein
MPRRPASPTPAPIVTRIVSGGQTGVDRAALDAALALRIPHGGWCPRGRLAEDGPIDARYQLRETREPEYAVRTERNVIDSDGTLILYRERLQGGTLLTNRLAKEHGRPLLRVRLDQPLDFDAALEWLRDHRIRELNVAGPRASSFPGIYDDALRYLKQLLSMHLPQPLLPDAETSEDLT